MYDGEHYITVVRARIMTVKRLGITAGARLRDSVSVSSESLTRVVTTESASLRLVPPHYRGSYFVL